MLKIDRLKAQIKEADCILDSKDITHAQEFQDLMVATYSSEIPFLAQKLSTYQYGASEDYLNDTRILKEILLNYQANIESGLTNSEKKDGRIVVTQQVQQQSNLSVNISIEQTLQAIERIPESILASEDKEILQGKLSSIEVTLKTDKKSAWGKISSVLKWIADKGIEVGVAALPYIVAALQKTP